MKRIDFIRNMTADEMATIVIEKCITDEYCKSDCEQCISGESICYSALEKQCAIRWLNEEMEDESCFTG